MTASNPDYRPRAHLPLRPVDGGASALRAERCKDAAESIAAPLSKEWASSSLGADAVHTWAWPCEPRGG